MPTVQIETQLTTDDLLRAVQQLSKNELEQFVFQVVNLRAKSQAPSLPKVEAELLQKINRGLPIELRKRYSDLVAKRSHIKPPIPTIYLNCNKPFSYIRL